MTVIIDLWISLFTTFIFDLHLQFVFKNANVNENANVDIDINAPIHICIHICIHTHISNP